MRYLLIATGGTGGHVKPAHLWAQQLTAQGHAVALIGPNLHKHRALDASNIPRFSLRHWADGWSALRAVRTTGATHVLGMGSRASVVTTLVGRALGCRVAIYELNALIGRANRLLRWVAPCAYAMPHMQTAWFLSPPVHPSIDRAQAAHYFGLAPQPTLFVFGGSQGAVFLNEVAREHFVRLCHAQDIKQIVHLTGRSCPALAPFYEAHGLACCVKTYEPKMEYAWSLATLVVGRAGAMSLFEQRAAQCPMVVIPYPHATDRHQWHNGQWAARWGQVSVLPQEHIAALTTAMQTAQNKSHHQLPWQEHTLYDWFTDK